MTKLFQRKSKSQLSPLHLRLLLTGGEVVAEGVGIHGKHALAEEGLVLVVDGDLGELSGEVGLEALLVGSGIVGAVGLVAVDPSKSARTTANYCDTPRESPANASLNGIVMWT